jgi:cysteinyl-tRNA synthetase
VTSLRIYDSLRHEKVVFEPLVPGKVGLYVCGPTPYAPAHIGHAYSAISFDTVRRGLEFLGYEVTYVRNVTDVEDKIIKRANETGEDPMALADRLAGAYNRDMAAFNVRPPDQEPRVSTHMGEIITVIEKLVENGCAYPVEGDVYYSIEAFPSYGKLSGQTIDKLRAGARVEVDERKRHPGDFALWKAAKPGEPFWESPWGKGRPGWHIECSAMTVAHLGHTFDLHGGGKDLIFPHHENEIAQSQGAYGTDTFARYWMHNGFLRRVDPDARSDDDDEKMSKSLGNVIDCTTIIEAVGGEALRFFCVKHHYRSPVDFIVENLRDPAGEIVGVRYRSLETADRELAYFYKTLVDIDTTVATGDGGDGPVLAEAERLLPAVREALLDDFNGPGVIAAMYEAATLANRLVKETKGIDKQQRKRTLARLGRDLRTAGTAVGLLYSDPQAALTARRDRLVKWRSLDVALIEGKIADRAAARAAKDWKLGDAIRDEIVALGVELHDGTGGTTWSVVDG